MDYPTYVIVNGNRYDINTDFRVAIECERIARDKSIGDFETFLAILYKLYGKKALENPNDYIELMKLAKKYLSCGKEPELTRDEPDMDYLEDFDLIEASFMSDFHIDLSNEKMHWWKFFKLLNGLSNSDTGNCCILNRVRNIRNMELSSIQDSKERTRLMKAKERFALKSTDTKNNLTKEQEESIRRLDEIIKRGESNA